MKYRIIKWLFIILAVTGFILEAKLAMFVCHGLGSEAC